MKKKPSLMEEGPELKAYRCAKNQRVPAASVCPFGCGVFSVCRFWFLVSASWDSFPFSLVGLGWGKSQQNPE